RDARGAHRGGGAGGRPRAARRGHRAQAVRAHRRDLRRRRRLDRAGARMSRRLTDPIPERPSAPREAVTAVVALGANLGDRAATLEAAVRELTRLPLVDDVVVSDP